MLGFIFGMISVGIASVIIGNVNEECAKEEKQMSELMVQIEKNMEKLNKYL
jgi:hypothetical protein